MEAREISCYVEAIKIAVGSVQYKNMSVKKTFLDVITQLYNYYEKLDNKKYLETAVLHIQAYLEMGFPYEENAIIFDKVLKQLGTSRELKFPKKFYKTRKIKLNKTQVKTMIKKWPASPRQIMKIDEVVTDIINKVSDREQGIFYYKCAVTGDLYELVISEREVFFHDMGRGLFYTFQD